MPCRPPGTVDLNVSCTGDGRIVFTCPNGHTTTSCDECFSVLAATGLRAIGSAKSGTKGAKRRCEHDRYAALFKGEGFSVAPQLFTCPECHSAMTLIPNQDGTSFAEISNKGWGKAVSLTRERPKTPPAGGASSDGSDQQTKKSKAKTKLVVPEEPEVIISDAAEARLRREEEEKKAEEAAIFAEFQRKQKEEDEREKKRQAELERELALEDERRRAERKAKKEAAKRRRQDSDRLSQSTQDDQASQDAVGDSPLDTGARAPQPRDPVAQPAPTVQFAKLAAQPPAPAPVHQMHPASLASATVGGGGYGAPYGQAHASVAPPSSLPPAMTQKYASNAPRSSAASAYAAPPPGVLGAPASASDGQLREREAMLARREAELHQHTDVLVQQLHAAKDMHDRLTEQQRAVESSERHIASREQQLQVLDTNLRYQQRVQEKNEAKLVQERAQLERERQELERQRDEVERLRAEQESERADLDRQAEELEKFRSVQRSVTIDSQGRKYVPLSPPFEKVRESNRDRAIDHCRELVTLLQVMKSTSSWDGADAVDVDLGPFHSTLHKLASSRPSLTAPIGSGPSAAGAPGMPPTSAAPGGPPGVLSSGGGGGGGGLGLGLGTSFAPSQNGSLW